MKQFQSFLYFSASNCIPNIFQYVYFELDVSLDSWAFHTTLNIVQLEVQIAVAMDVELLFHICNHIGMHDVLQTFDGMFDLHVHHIELIHAPQ